MIKKQFNYLGFILVSLYIFIFIFIIVLGVILGIWLNSKESWHICGYLFGISIIWACSWIRIIPSTLYKTRFNLLTDKYVQARIISKGVHQTSKGLTVHKRSVIHTILTFELPDYTRMSFEVKPVIFHTFLENDVGILFYRQYEQKVFFVKFERK